MVEKNPKSSINTISETTEISKSSIQRILKSYNFHPYHIELNKEFYGDDFSNRITFCTWLLNKIIKMPNFLSQILFSDETTFKNNGVFNKHNMHYYATKNRHWTRNINQQNRWFINVWGGILGDKIIGPYFFEDYLT